MSEEEREEGKRWIVETLQRLSREMDVPIDSLEWGVGSEDFDRRLFSLAVEVDGKRRIEKFSVAEIEDCPGDKNVRAALETRIKMFLKSLRPTGKKIGF